MKPDTREVIETLTDLIQLDYDAVRAYEQAIERVEDEEVESALESFLVDHERHITDLSQLVRELGGRANGVHRDLKGVLLEGLTAFRSVTGTLGALKAMRSNEKLTNSTYEKVASLDLPPHVRAVIAVNAEDERRHLAVIEMHIDRLTHHDVDAAEELAEDARRADHPHVRM